MSLRSRILPACAVSIGLLLAPAVLAQGKKEMMKDEPMAKDKMMKSDGMMKEDMGKDTMGKKKEEMPMKSNDMKK